MGLRRILAAGAVAGLGVLLTPAGAWAEYPPGTTTTVTSTTTTTLAVSGVTVVRPIAPAPQAVPVPQKQLAFTGALIDGGVTAGLCALGIGAGLLAASRRRRPAPQ